MTTEQRERAREIIESNIDVLDADANHHETRYPNLSRRYEFDADALRAVLALIDADEAAERDGGA